MTGKPDLEWREPIEHADLVGSVVSVAFADNQRVGEVVFVPAADHDEWGDPENPQFFAQYRGHPLEPEGHHSQSDAEDEVRAAYDSGLNLWD